MTHSTGKTESGSSAQKDILARVYSRELTTAAAIAECRANSLPVTRTLVRRFRRAEYVALVHHSLKDSI